MTEPTPPIFGRKARGRLCVRCGERWIQSASQRCRRCDRELGEARRPIEEDAALVARLQQKRAVVALPHAARPTVTRIYDGQAFEIAWDGS